VLYPPELRAHKDLRGVTFGCSDYRRRIFNNFTSDRLLPPCVDLRDERIAKPFEFPSSPSSGIVLKPTPAIASLEANVCLKVCGVTSVNLAFRHAVVNCVRMLLNG
jgi:hypothetical protein